MKPRTIFFCLLGLSLARFASTHASDGYSTIPPLRGARAVSLNIVAEVKHEFKIINASKNTPLTPLKGGIGCTNSLRLMPIILCCLQGKSFQIPLQEEPTTQRHTLLREDSAVVQVRKIDAWSLSEYYADSDFVYDRPLPATLTWWERFQHWLGRRLSELFSSPAGEAFWEVFPYVFVAGVVIFVLFHLLQGEFGGVFYKPGTSRTELGRQELENFHATNFATLISSACAERQYRLAVRYLFLKTLQQLAAQQRIAWKAEKTNHDYLSELRASPLHQPFRELVWWFEHVWYGEFSVNEATFARAQAAFRAFEAAPVQAVSS